MKKSLDSELMRLLHGELPRERERELEELLRRDPELARRYRRLAASWERLELPVTPPPPGFHGRVLARVRAEAARAAGLAARRPPTWARAFGVVALAVGAAVGAWLAAPLREPAPAVSASPEAVYEIAAEPTLADAYWTVVGVETEAGSGGTR